MTTLDPASFRDPAGHEWHEDGRVFRTVSAAGAADYRFVADSGALQPLVAEGLLISAREDSTADLKTPRRKPASFSNTPGCHSGRIPTNGRFRP